MKEIKLSRGQVALVDDDDYENLNQYKWHALFDKVTNCYYAKTSHVMREGELTSQLMHRAITNTFDGLIHVDHSNHNTLDNTKDNLRIATPSQNGANRKLNVNNVSGFKGVNQRKDSKKWVAQIRVNQRKIFLGSYNDVKNAALAYNEAAIKYFGEYALINAME